MCDFLSSFYEHEKKKRKEQNMKKKWINPAEKKSEVVVYKKMNRSKIVGRPSREEKRKEENLELMKIEGQRARDGVS